MDGTKVETDGATVIDEKPDEVVVDANAGEPDGQGGGADDRDYDAEARRHGWSPKEEFRGDPGKWVDAKTFVDRADTFMPFLQKQNKALKGEIDDLKRQMKQAGKHFEKAEQRAYERALSDLEARHDEAVDKGDAAEARKIVKEMRDLEKPEPIVEDKADDGDLEARRANFTAWVEENDWYTTDANMRLYADTQAQQMGPADKWPEGDKAWLDELAKRTKRKFADKKPSAVNGGGNRQQPGSGGKSFSDLPPAARAACDKWHKNGLFGNITQDEARKRYVADYDWS